MTFNRAKEALLGLPAIALCLCALTSCDVGSESRSSNGESERPNDRRRDVWIEARQHVEARLVSPSTADYGTQEQSYQKSVKVLDGGRYLVHGWVDSQNRFGAMIRSRFEIELRYVGGERWELCAPIEARGDLILTRITTDKMQRRLKEGDAGRKLDLLRMKRLKQLRQQPRWRALSNDDLAEADRIIAALTQKYGDMGFHVDRAKRTVESFPAAPRKLEEVMRQAAIADVEAAMQEANRNRSALQNRKDLFESDDD